MSKNAGNCTRCGGTDTWHVSGVMGGAVTTCACRTCNEFFQSDVWTAEEREEIRKRANRLGVAYALTRSNGEWLFTLGDKVVFADEALRFVQAVQA